MKQHTGKYRSKTRAKLLFITLLLVTVTGCGQSVETKQDHVEENPNIQIGFTMDSFLIERWQRDRDVFVSKAKRLGADVNVQNANGSLEEQISQINYFIEKDVDVIVVVATDCEGLSEAILKAKKEGIPVVAYDRLINRANVDAFVSFDNQMVGELMGRAIADKLPEGGNILMMNGPLTDSNVPFVMEGFQQAIADKNINILDTGYAANWRAEDAFDFTGNYLSREEAVIPDAIMCGNDSLAGQATKALAERRLAGKVIVTGQDADLDACQRIVEGTQYMTVYKPVEKLAERAAEIAVALAVNEPINTSDTIHDGTYDVPYEKLTPVAVTKENIDEVIIGSYHQRKEVYLNVREE